MRSDFRLQDEPMPVATSHGLNAVIPSLLLDIKAMMAHVVGTRPRAFARKGIGSKDLRILADKLPPGRSLSYLHFLSLTLEEMGHLIEVAEVYRVGPQIASWLARPEDVYRDILGSWQRSTLWDDMVPDMSGREQDPLARTRGPLLRHAILARLRGSPLAKAASVEAMESLTPVLPSEDEAQAMILGVLSWLAVVEVDRADKVRLTPIGRSLLQNTPFPAPPAPDPEEKLVIQPTGEVIVPSTASADLILRLASFARLQRADLAMVFTLDSQSLADAIAQGIAPAEARAFLEEASRSPLPQPLLFAIEELVSQGTDVQIWQEGQALLLRADSTKASGRIQKHQDLLNWLVPLDDKGLFLTKAASWGELEQVVKLLRSRKLVYSLSVRDLPSDRTVGVNLTQEQAKTAYAILKALSLQSQVEEHLGIASLGASELALALESAAERSGMDIADQMDLDLRKKALTAAIRRLQEDATGRALSRAREEWQLAERLRQEAAIQEAKRQTRLDVEQGFRRREAMATLLERSPSAAPQHSLPQPPPQPAPKARAKGERTCTVEGCNERHLARGLCTRHYHIWRRHKLEQERG